MMVDPRVKGVLLRLVPALLPAGAATLTLFLLMALIVSTDKPTVLAEPIPTVRTMSSHGLSPALPPLLITARIEKEVPKSFFTKANDTPNSLALTITPKPKINFNYDVARPDPAIDLTALTSFKLKSLDHDAYPLTAIDPLYPAKALHAGIEGHVVVSMSVSAEGDVKDVRILSASPVGYFEDVALKTASKFRFKPRMINGKAVVANNVPYRWDFTLNEE